MQPEGAAEFVKNFEREKCDLPFVIIFEIEIAIVADTASGDALDHRHFNCRIRIRFPSVMTYEIMTWRNVKMADFHRLHANIDQIRFT